jgi:hypothetical protein
VTTTQAAEHPWHCRWDFIERPRAGRRSSRTLVWICEYPYRTIRSGPSDDCEGCRQAVARAAEAELTAELRALEHAFRGQS